MRGAIWLATAILFLSLDAAGAEAVPLYQRTDQSAAAEMHQAAAMAPANRPEVATTQASSLRTIRHELGASLRTAFLLGFAGVLIGLGAVGVKSLWVAEEAEYAALSQDFREIAPGSDRMLTCLGDYPA